MISRQDERDLAPHAEVATGTAQQLAKAGGVDAPATLAVQHDDVQLAIGLHDATAGAASHRSSSRRPG